ncbi:MAG: vitamin K epoxide reductase family protein [Sporichthyaceae bacterium]
MAGSATLLAAEADADAAPATPPHPERTLGWLLLVAGLVGFAAAFTLMVEKLAILTDPTYTPSCSLNPILNCGSIMKTDQAEAFGFPNPLIGVAAFPVLAATGAALIGGARFARLYWIGLQAGVTFAAGFVGWLIFQSLYRIGALCPYCMIVWVAVLPVFVEVTLRNAQSGVFGPRLAASRGVRVIASWRIAVITATGLVVSALIAEQFWYYWRTLV